MPRKVNVASYYKKLTMLTEKCPKSNKSSKCKQMRKKSSKMKSPGVFKIIMYEMSNRKKLREQHKKSKSRKNRRSRRRS
jgi:hypothetical protein